MKKIIRPRALMWRFWAVLAISFMPAFKGVASDSDQLATNADTNQVSAITPRELLARMHSQTKVTFENAIGGYVYRIYNHTSDEKKQAELQATRESLVEAKRIRMINERTLGRTPDEEALDEEIEETLQEIRLKTDGDGWQTFAAQYTQQNDSYRIEQATLPNETPIEELVEEFENGSRKFEPNFTRTWNGELYAQLFLGGEDGHNVPAISYEDQAKGVVKFMKLSREAAADSTVIAKLLSADMVSVINEITTENGDSAYRFQLGDKDKTPLAMEMIVLPSKGYSVSRACTWIDGSVIAKDEFDDFVPTDAGIWVPTRIDRETHGYDEKTRTFFLKTKEQLIAFEEPQTGVAIAEATFDLSATDEFKAFPLSTHLLPAGSPFVEKPAGTLNSRAMYVFWILIVNAALLVGVGFLIKKKRTSTERQAA